MFVEWELAGETEVLGETLPNATFFATNPIWYDLGSKPVHRGGKPATSCLGYIMVNIIFILSSVLVTIDGVWIGE
jgi:hypothetical protein